VCMVQEALAGGGQDHSTGVRLVLMGEACDGIFKDLGSFLFGYGIGSFGEVAKGTDIRLYPHNMILEVWFELGLVGLLLLLAWVFFIIWKMRSMPSRFISYWVLFYVFLNLMKSSSLIDIRTEFAFLGLFVVQNLIVIQRAQYPSKSYKLNSGHHPSPATSGSAGEGQG